MDYIDHDAERAAWESAAEALKIFQKSPHLTTLERVAVLNDQFAAGRQQIMDSYQPSSDADEAWQRAVGTVLGELKVGRLIT